MIHSTENRFGRQDKPLVLRQNVLAGQQLKVLRDANKFCYNGTQAKLKGIQRALNKSFQLQLSEVFLPLFAIEELVVFEAIDIKDGLADGIEEAMNLGIGILAFMCIEVVMTATSHDVQTFLHKTRRKEGSPSNKTACIGTARASSQHVIRCIQKLVQ